MMIGPDTVKLFTAGLAIQLADATLSLFQCKVEGCVPGGSGGVIHKLQGTKVKSPRCSKNCNRRGCLGPLPQCPPCPIPRTLWRGFLHLAISFYRALLGFAHGHLWIINSIQIVNYTFSFTKIKLSGLLPDSQLPPTPLYPPAFFKILNQNKGCLSGSVDRGSDCHSGYDLSVQEFEPCVGLC